MYLNKIKFYYIYICFISFYDYYLINSNIFGGFHIVMKLPLLNNLGSITGGMTSTPALGTLCKTAGTDDVASAYASTYPIALVLIVLACQLMITLM